MRIQNVECARKRLLKIALINLKSLLNAQHASMKVKRHQSTFINYSKLIYSLLQLIPRALKCHSACSYDHWLTNGNVLIARHAESVESKRTTRCCFVFNVIAAITFIVWDFVMFRKVVIYFWIEMDFLIKKNILT